MREIFRKQFGSAENLQVYQAPARINIIGEHVDYLGGIVLPAAIDYSIQAAIRPIQKKSYRLYSYNYESFWESSEVTKSDKNPWANYIMGVLDQLEARNFDIPGFELAFGGNIPPGSGLSSSAALEVVVAYALNDLFNLGLSLKEIALIGQYAEHEFVGTKCGIMDQFIIAHGKQDHCISLDTETLEFNYHNFRLGNMQFSLVHSHVKHSLNDSEYNTRRRECESALNKINSSLQSHKKESLKNLYSLSIGDDISIYDLNDKEIKRVRHVITEKKRTQDVIKGLELGDFELVGRSLTECHWSLSKDFEVSCKETDWIVDYLSQKGALGSRMIGGGFGGCVLVLAPEGWIDSIKDEFIGKYKVQFGLEGSVNSFQIVDGVKRIE